MPESCQNNTCTYYGHYLVHYDPDRQGEKLEHEAYHQAEKQCEHWQKIDDDWITTKMKYGDRGELHSPFEKQCKFWENKVAA